MAEVAEEIPEPLAPEVEAVLPIIEPVPIEVVEPIAVPVPETVFVKDVFADKISAAVKQAFMPEDAEFLAAKSFLTSKIGVKHPVSMYEHLTTLIMHSLETKSNNLVDNFEKMSLSVKAGQFAVDLSNPTSLKQIRENHVQLASSLSRLATLKQNTEDVAEAEVGDIPDMMDLSSLWEWAGISFGKEDTFLLFLSIKKLVEAKQLKSARLWGKIFGRDANYIIAEAELKEGVEDVDDAIANEQAPIEEVAVAKEETLIEGVAKVPVPKVKEFSALSKEIKSGSNKYIYYACHTVSGQWTRLPDVIPERLQESRSIRKFFTGHLDALIYSYPGFKGNEAQYLRCQIARISAATVVSPKGYYTIDPEAEESDETGANLPIIINPEYEGLPNDQLANVANWVHHIPFVLPQGRIVWESPKLVKEATVEGGEEEKDDDEDVEEETPAEPELGPAPLTIISSDEDHGNIPAWSSRLCSRLSPLKFTPVTLRSNRWPGASVLAYNDKFANIYIGDGLKDLGNPVQNFIPLALTAVMKEYAGGDASTGNPELLIEQIDLSVEAENAIEDAKKGKDEEGKEVEDGDEGEAAEADE